MRWIILGLCLAGCAPGRSTVVSALPPQPFCTRTLGLPQCFANPAALPDHPAGLADTPVREHVECHAWWQDGALVCLLEQPPRP